MRILLITLNLLLFVNGFAQEHKNWPAPDKEKKQKCYSLETKTKVSGGLVYTQWLEDTLKLNLDTFLYNQIDSIRVLYGSNSSLKPLFENGILNGRDLVQSEILRLVNYPTAFMDYGLEKQFLKADKEPDDWKGYVIMIGETSMPQHDTDTIKAFSFGMRSETGSSISIYYLELKNKFWKPGMSTKEFIKNAYISCLLKWYAII